ncbi:MAG: VWA domain-containing protein [Alphaproteobacteria bacterium]|nr:MAG: VWA domain-containing protein [Alphaproteobacteria bacterium]
MRLPRAAYPFVEFPAILRAHGFAIAPDQTIGFIEAVGLLGPRSIADIHAAGLALLAIPRERREEYDALFRAYFMGQTVAAPAEGEEGEELEAHEPQGGAREVEAEEEEGEAGTEAAAAERLSHRAFEARGEDAALAAFRREAPARLPRRHSRRRARATHGDRLDMRRALREAVRREGELFRLPMSARKLSQRRIVLLIDVSGSMKDQSETSLRFAHALAQVAERFEVFTLGTRLTRITPAMRLRQRDRALARAGAIVADFDGGTRLGEALGAFLAVPRFAGFARGAAVIVLSDGLERGDPSALVAAVQRLSRLAWRLDWLTPLAAEPGFEPRTEALAAILPWIDSLGPGAGVGAIAAHVLNLAREAA